MIPHLRESGSTVRTEGRTKARREAGAGSPLKSGWLESEAAFYLAHRWALNAFPTVAELMSRLGEELEHVERADEPWHRGEACVNVLLMSCAIADTIDNLLAGARYDAAKVAKYVPLAGSLARAGNGVLVGLRHLGALRRRGLRRWRAEWGAAIEAFAAATIVSARPNPYTVGRACARIETLLETRLPEALRARRPRIPGAFRRHDLTHHDAVALSRRFTARCPDRGRPILVVGLRTAGSYFAPVVAASLRCDGYEAVATVTIHPKKGITRGEALQVMRGAQRGALALLVDEPPDTGATIARAAEALQRLGFGRSGIVAMFPVHPNGGKAAADPAQLAIDDAQVVRLEPEAWHKSGLLALEALATQLRPYFASRGYSQVDVVESPLAAAFNATLGRDRGAGFGSRLKRVVEVRLATPDGRRETRYVLAKSVGWGWLAYHAFAAADALVPFVPPALGLRSGILYTEWLPQQADHAPYVPRERVVDTIASYVATRARSLKLDSDPSSDLARQRYHDGIELLGNALGGMYGSRIAAALRGPRIRRELAGRSKAVAALIDGRMRPQEWIVAGPALLKTDFEHHGLGKSELNITDPAYDLADAILGFGLTPSEERHLLARYAEETGDDVTEERLLLHKLLAGSAAMHAALACLGDAGDAARHAEENQRYLDAWHFLVRHAARFCGSAVAKPPMPRWSSPLMVLDIDGVLDTRQMGFPCTSAAGIEALSLLHAHGLAIALDSARPIGEVREYCKAYGCAGGVAEYGSVVWDAISDRTRVVASADALREMHRVRAALGEMDDVFLDDAHCYSIRAYRIAGHATEPLPEATVSELLERVGARALVARRNAIDTAIHARNTDKGTGLRALLDLIGLPDPETVAVGDSEVDLAMFRMAQRSFAPASVTCRQAAALVGCRIVAARYQRGLLQAVRHVVHPNGGRCPLCAAAVKAQSPTRRLLLGLLGCADQTRMRSLLGAALDPLAIRAFLSTE